MGLHWDAAAADGPELPTTAELRGHVQLTIPHKWNGNRYVHIGRWVGGGCGQKRRHHYSVLSDTVGRFLIMSI